MPTSLPSYLRELGQLPPLGKADEQQLLHQLTRDPGGPAAHHLVERNLRFVVSVAARYRNRGIPFEDLIGEGNIGLLEATSRFDARRRVRFLTCAVWWIRRAILRSLEEKGSLVRIPPYQERKRRMAPARPPLTVRGEPARRRRLASGAEEISRLPVGTFGSREPVSLDAPMREPGASNSGDVPLIEALADRGRPDPESQFLRDELNLELVRALRELPPREGRILASRFGLDGGEPATLGEVGDRFGLSRERIRQIERAALARMRKTLGRGTSSHAVHTLEGAP